MLNELSVEDSFFYYAGEKNLPVIPLCPPSHNKMTPKHKENCKRPGKRPLIKDWQFSTVPEQQKIEKWLDKRPDCNIGVVLGSASGICGIDVDGEEGSLLLQEMSNGDLPITWQFKTPNNGMRYLYRIPQGLTLHKHTQSGESPHSECALLGEGQMTVLPPSKLVTGKYKWVKGKSPAEIELADAPPWMVNRMMRGQTCLTNSPSPSEHDPIKILKSNCSRFNTDLLTQQAIGLSEQDWFHWVSLLVNAGQTESALAFSQMSSKHNSNSIARINHLSQKPCGMVRCSTLKCTDEQINHCFSGNLKLNTKKQVTNSPGSFIRKSNKTGLDQSELEEIGFNFNKEKQIRGVNGNLFASHILKHHDLLYTSGDRFYFWENGVWKFVDENKLSRVLRDFLHQYAPHLWTVKIEEAYLEPLKREAPRVEQLDANRQYINLENGMFDLKTFRLIPHQKELYSSIQVPIRYDPNAECPTFMKFLNEVFESDQERINLTGEIFGYCLTAETKTDNVFILYGKGANGKSVLADVLLQLCGKENCSAVSLKELGSPFARLDLVDKLVNIATENEIGSRDFDTQHLKSITSGDPIRVEIKHGKSFMYKPICKLFFALNNLPYSKDKSDGYLRRLTILPFNKSFKGKKADVHLRDKLKAELPGILNFALKGLQRLRKNKYLFTESSAVNQTVMDYADRLNPLRIFVDDMIEGDEHGNRIPYSNLRSKYVEWASRSGYASSYNENTFAENLKNVLRNKEIPFDSFKRSRGIRGIVGIRWKMGTDESNTERGSVNESYEEIDDIDLIDS